MFDYLNQLEEKVTRITGLYASLKGEKDRLARENSELKKRVEELETEKNSLTETQGQIKERVEALIQRIEGLEDR